MSLSAGDRLGRYEILGPIGAGGMGEVWKALDTELERTVAVKVLPESVAEDPSRLERFQREARALAALSHPNLLDIYDVGSTNGLHYAVTELLEGDTLRQKIPTSGLPWQKVAAMGAAAADGMAAAHGKGIVHRDLKPENLFVTADGRVKILDFGLAKVEEDFDPEGETGTLTPAGTEAGTIMGTPGYMAPEQVKGKPADPRSDIFALGCVLYEMVAGHRAFGGDTGMEVMAAILKEEPPQLSSSGAAVPVDLERAIHRCLEKRPEARFQSSADLAYSLKSVGSSQAVPVMATPTPTAVTPVTEKKRPWWQVAVAGALVVIAAVIVWQAVFPTGEPPPVEMAVELNPDRIAVVPFTNRSGDASFDGLGRRAADRIARELAQIEELEVVPVESIADRASAGLIVSGVIDADGDGPELRAALENAVSGHVVRSFDPLGATPTEFAANLDTLAGWVWVTVLEELHPSLRFGASEHIPSPAAFREYLACLPIAGMDPAAEDHFFRALDLDPDFHRARFWGIFAAWSGAMWSLADNLLRPLEDARAELSPSQQSLVDAGRWGLQGRWVGALGILQEYSANHPDDCMARACVVKTALWANRPRLALEAFRLYRWDPVHSSMQLKVVSSNAAWGHHRLGQYEEELALLRRLWEEQPAFFGTTWFRASEARALVALGRLDECRSVIAEAMTEPTYEPERYGELMVRAAAELRVHGHGDASRAMAERALEWFERTELPPQSEISALELSIEALDLLGRHREAYELTRVLLAAKPDRWQSQAMVGVTAARADDEAVAREISDRLAALDEPFTFGMPHHYRAAIAAQLGNRSEAIRLLRASVSKGFPRWDFLHVGTAFDPLRDDPEFQEIMRPKG